MQQHAQQVADPVQAEFYKAIGQECAHARTFGRRAASLRERQIPPSPLLDQCSENRATKTDDQTVEPEDVDRDNIKRGLEWLASFRRYDLLDRDPLGVVVKLVRCLGDQVDRLVQSLNCLVS